MMKIDRKKFLDNIYINSDNFTVIEEALDDAEINSLFEVMRPLPIAKIKNKLTRRVLMILLFPGYLLIMILINAAWMPFLFIIRIINGGIFLYNSVLKRWDESVQ